MDQLSTPQEESSYRHFRKVLNIVAIVVFIALLAGLIYGFSAFRVTSIDIGDKLRLTASSAQEESYTCQSSPRLIINYMGLPSNTMKAELDQSALTLRRHGLWGSLETQLSDLSDGQHIIKVSAGRYSINWLFFVDTQVPAMKLDAPANNFATNSENITFSGQSKPGAKLVIKTEKQSVRTVIEDDGYFEVKVPIVHGVNTIKWAVSDRAGNCTAGDLRVLGDFTPPSVEPTLESLDGAETATPKTPGVVFSERNLVLNLTVKDPDTGIIRAAYKLDNRAAVELTLPQSEKQAAGASADESADESADASGAEGGSSSSSGSSSDNSSESASEDAAENEAAGDDAGGGDYSEYAPDDADLDDLPTEIDDSQALLPSPARPEKLAQRAARSHFERGFVQTQAQPEDDDTIGDQKASPQADSKTNSQSNAKANFGQSSDAKDNAKADSEQSADAAKAQAKESGAQSKQKTQKQPKAKLEPLKETQVKAVNLPGEALIATGCRGVSYKIPLNKLYDGEHSLEIIGKNGLGVISKRSLKFCVNSTEKFGEATLYMGATGADVAELQKRLAKRGYLTDGYTEGKYDEATREAVTALQNHIGVNPDGMAGPMVFGAIDKRIYVNLSRFEVKLVLEDDSVRTYPICTGVDKHPTPTGWFYIADMAKDPTWLPPNSEWAKDAKVIEPGPDNPLGTRWIGLDNGAIGFHGTLYPDSVGTQASHGCMRMRLVDIEDFYDRVTLGTQVRIYKGDEDDQILQTYWP